MKQLMLGNEAVARGLWEAGCRTVFAYPGTPSTEITEFAADYPELTVEWSPNEKVALEAAFGASLMGARSLCAMKHVGLNVAADPLYTASYTGVGGGLVVAVADDPGMHSSQNEQDTRRHAIAAKLPLLEPADSADCRELVMLAFEISERFDTPVILRLTTRVAHTRSLVETGPRSEQSLKEYKKDSRKNCMIPAFARERRLFIEERTERLRQYAEQSGINTEISGEGLGIAASGMCYQYALDGAPAGSGFLKLRMPVPFPAALIKDFAQKHGRLVVAEELDPVIEEGCRINGIACEGRTLFSGIGELSTAAVREALGGQKPDSLELASELPARPPVLCAGCPHRAVFSLLHKLKLTVSGDIGCYALGVSPPLAAVDSILCMGASISGLHGMLKARPEMATRAVAVIGDSTFVHSGITGLVDIVYNGSNATVIILDNSTTGMTGHQPNPATGYDIRGGQTPRLDLEAVCRACGVGSVTVCDPCDLAESERVIRRELEFAGPSVIIMRRPCVLLKTTRRAAPLAVDADSCRGCRQCVELGCPAISFENKKAKIDPAACVGCGLCGQVCAFKAIKGGCE